MRKEAFQLLHDIEDSWWYQGRKLIVSKVLRRFLVPDTAREVLDFGAGYGGMHGLLARFGKVSAFEPDEGARRESAGRGYARMFSDKEGVLREVKNFSLIGLFDVIEHVEDDKEFLRLLHDSLPVGGHVIITAPAYQWLFGAHDVSHHHYRRYTRGGFQKLLRGSGFVVRYSGYWNMFLFLPAALARFMGMTGESSLHSTSFLSRFFLALVRIESLLIPSVSLPFGTSIIALVRKKS